MAPNPYLISEPLANGKFKYVLLGITLQGDESDEKKAKAECDELVTQILAELDKCEQKGDQYFVYPTLGLKVSAANREDADKAAAARIVNRLSKGKSMLRAEKKVVKDAKKEAEAK